MLTSCTAIAPGAGGPTAGAINKSDGVMIGSAPIQVVDVTDPLARFVEAAHRERPLSQTLGDAAVTQTIIGHGDLLQVTVMEAPPAVLFGGNRSFGASSVAGGEMIGSSATIPELMVDENGQIRVPFAGAITAAGRTPQQVERQIQARLKGMAHDPQVSVRIAQNMSSTVAVVGEVGKSGRVPITPTGERLLDVISLAGGPSRPVGKVMVQVTRQGQVAAQPLEEIIRDPAQNIRVGRNDIVTLHYQPYSFTALGAASKSGEIDFESTGLTLANAMGRVGGLRDDRANAKGAFVFRFETPSAVAPEIAAISPRTADGRIPIIYRVDFRNPATLFAAQHFPMRDEDILYVASAPISDLQRFVGILSSMAFTFIGLGQAVPGLVQ
ncbi:polysaccharide biosynthesis/export family protein [Sphingomonas piscis]|nr:polysaccharide biosynthesis/export family protein [Sphingomonas piscis]